MTLAEAIAEWMKLNDLRHAFGIVGAGICPLFDAIHRLGYTQIVNTHHEQAAAMAAAAYYRTCGKLAPCLVTTGGGSSNAITGVLAAHMDSVPLLVISGNEPSKCTMGEKRAKGVQGFMSNVLADSVCKMAMEVTEPSQLNLSNFASVALRGRPGPVWMDIPMDVQQKQTSWIPAKIETGNEPGKFFSAYWEIIRSVSMSLRPAFWLGNGVRLAGAADLVGDLLDHFRIPTVLSWSGADLIDNSHWLHYGRPGVYGQRCANLVVQNADLIVAIGTRLTLPQTAYGSCAKNAKFIHVDVDSAELDSASGNFQCDAKTLIETMLAHECDAPKEWLDRCDSWRDRYPWVESPTHDSKDGYVNSYRFIQEIEKHLKSDQVVVTDMGAALLSAHQALKLKRGQRLFTSQGLGEMGCGLPFAVGAAFASGREVLCLNTDGGMMMNLQELETIRYHNLPVKIVVFCNDGYGMIKNTQETQYGGRLVGVNRVSGVSTPNFSHVAQAFGILDFEILQGDSMDVVKEFMSYDEGPVLLRVEINPDQKYLPKLQPYKNEAGELVSPPMEDLSPMLPRDVLAKEMAE